MIYTPIADDGPADWGVACTCREPTQLVIAFVAHHIAIGAKEVWMFLDEPQPDLEALLAQIPQVKMHVCDTEFWLANGGRRPAAIEPRQVQNIHYTYHKTDLPWIAHLDCDEFLHADVPISDILAALPPDVDYAVCLPRERAFVQGVTQDSIFDGVFRKPVPRAWVGAPPLFADGQKFLQRGILGHAVGKSIMRTGRHLVPGIHTPRRPRAHRSTPLHGWEIARARMLHFDGLTALHWSAKLLRAAIARDQRRAKGKADIDDHRDQQITRMQQSGTNLDSAWQMHDTLKSIHHDQVDRLRVLAMVEDYALTVEDDIAALGLDYTCDLSQQAFDAALAKQQGQVSDWYVPWQDILKRKAAEASET